MKLNLIKLLSIYLIISLIYCVDIDTARRNNINTNVELNKNNKNNNDNNSKKSEDAPKTM